MNVDAVRAILARARAERRDALLEPEGLELLGALGIAHPRYRFLERGAAVPPSTGLQGTRVVVKVVSPEILHKSDVGGVAIVANDGTAVVEAIAGMESRLGGGRIAGFLLVEYIDHDASLGGELLAGLRWTSEFGPVVTFGAGGITTETLARSLQPGRDAAIVSTLLPRDRWEEALSRVLAVSMATRAFRGRPAAVPLASITALVETLAALAAACMPDGISDFEINPLGIAGGRLVALDVLVTLSSTLAVGRAPRPIHKIARLLRPHRAAVVGVSDRMNPGRVILDNMLRGGFEPSRIAVVKAGSDTVAGCRCYPDVESLPEPVDLLVLATAAVEVPSLLRDVVRHRKAEGVIVISGGLEEKSGSESLVREMQETLAASRATSGQGPVVNGGNCLGIRSRPGRCDTLFIPAYKMPPTHGARAPVALLCQSGAFAIARASRLAGLDPDYLITVGNQSDLTFGDYLTFLEEEPGVEVIGAYVEGFQEQDGLRFAAAAQRMAAAGRTVILYRAGRTEAGARATASHTASIAGDPRVARAVCEQAGIVVADTLEDFDDLVSLFTRLRDRPPAGLRLAALSNAGFESVAFADGAAELSLASLTETTRDRLRVILERRGLARVVDVQHPVDLTPMADDAAFEAAVHALLSDEGVDMGVIGCVPMTPSLATLPAGSRHTEDLASGTSIVARLARIRREIAKPWVAVVDAGPLYDPMVAALETAGIPTFRTADRAVRLLGVFGRARVGRPGRPERELAGYARYTSIL